MKWYYDQQGQPSYYQVGAWLFDPDGMPTFLVVNGCWYRDGRAAYCLKDKWAYPTEGGDAFYTD